MASHVLLTASGQIQQAWSMELFVLGPAFGLPSIDAECIAVVALLRSLDRKDWLLIPTHDGREGLPLLVSGDQRICGFKNISRHLGADKNEGDAIALASFLERGAQTLLDISLYVSFENYSTTRSAFTQILPWHTNYILPPRLRAAARARTDHLSISSIDVDNVHEDLSGRTSSVDGMGKEQAFEVEAQKRASLLLPRKDTLGSLLQKPQHSAVFKLHALADNFFGPLQDMLGGKNFLQGAEMTSVDCLACGYLCLMLYPKMPQDWLASTMRRKYAPLVAYVERMYKKLGLQTNVGAVMSLTPPESEIELLSRLETSELTLPWQATVRDSFLNVLAMTAQELVSHIPGLKPSTSVVTVRPDTRLSWQRQLPTILAVLAATLGLSMFAGLRTGLLTWPRGEELHVFGRKRFSDYGHLGAVLAGMSVLSQQTRSSASPQTGVTGQGSHENATIVDVQVDVEPTSIR
ncbi:hypothetical protein LTR91_024539 [Friedmanniomyces endolithicus]|uniref:Mitochondrial outer membrane transport complex Sam37/metaxin N-terminal domain-containing protein n=1 Tax=Friedmanniomyces endolithicus TaxID=329885 RepID=A0AAN6H0F4_9PEZI|nr:hypothetical protein LTR59_002042 [Friedmanniomyces endolithicus]KAK0842447.1 hypothetical protein LTS02_016485 [Friedmanniomyces endolithicus]KAK0914221.1 hypothetical protein LTR57_014049 [Friedmanniomyces endolithicus]KAK0952211.1 hypothetical protein LTR91_024539 [Friedmanniomyces endolithicus]KAK1051438.1 hypothetical protein LTS16_002309 [Friedmanniomyces endolithicus]